MRENRCLIIGAGVGGLAAAAALAQRGIDVDIVEIKPDDSALGVGINLPANALRVARELGILDELIEHGFPPAGRRVHDHLGTLLHAEEWSTIDELPRAVAITRPALGAILLASARRAGAAVSFETTVLERHEDADGVDVRFSDGRRGRYDVVLAFDGIRSALRRELFGAEYDPVYSGFGVYRVTVERPTWLRAVHQYIGVRNKAGVIPLSEREMYMFLVVPAPVNWRPSRDALVEHLRGELEDYDGPIGDIRRGLTARSNIVFGAIEEVAVPPPWHRGRVIILGDAAHACAPHLTQGGAQAMEDAVIIAQTLAGAGTVEERLAAFEARRYPRVSLNQSVSHAILVGEMNHDPDHQRHWPQTFAGYIREADELLVVAP